MGLLVFFRLKNENITYKLCYVMVVLIWKLE